MSLDRVPAGAKLPNEFNVVIEISMNSSPVKYEVDKASGAVFVDRFMLTAMHYPCNYGYIPETIADDGDPVDVLELTPFPVQSGSVIRSRAVGVLQMDDEAGGDAKRSEEHTSELQSLMRISYAVFSWKKKKTIEYKTINE